MGNDTKKQITGIEPASPAWEAGVLPMNHICIRILYHISDINDKIKSGIIKIKKLFLKWKSYRKRFQKIGS